MKRSLISVRVPSLVGACLLLAVACAEPRATAPTPSAPAGSSASPAPHFADLAVVVGPVSVVGWWDRTAWVRPEDATSVPAAAGDSYTVLELGREARTAVGSEPRRTCEELGVVYAIDVPGVEQDFSTADPPPVAVSGVTTPLPRPVEVLDPGAAVYREAASALLRELGAGDVDAEVIQAVRADLEGDGRTEVVLVAEHIADPELFARVGDYSVVFLRRVENDRVTTSVVVQSIPDPGPNETPFVESHRLSALADLNGDGRLELAVSDRQYEGAGMAVYEIDPGGEPVRVLSAGCGA